MKFQKYLSDNCVPEWRLAYVDYKSLKKKINLFPGRDDRSFFFLLDQQMEKISQFFSEQCRELENRYLFLKYETENGQRENFEGKRNKRVRFLLREFHQYCTFLENFQKLNKIAYAKIMKKYDKTFSSDTMERINLFLDNDIFTSTLPEEYARKTEELVTLLFTFLAENHPNGSRGNGSLGSLGGSLKKKRKKYGTRTPQSLAIRYLRDVEPPRDDIAFFRVGLFIGISGTLLVFSGIIIAREDLLFRPVFRQVLYVYGGMFIIVLSFFGFALDIFLWTSYRINYIFIFELNSRTALTYKQYFEFSAVSFFLWSIFLYFTVHETFPGLPTRFTPLILIGLYIFVTILPLPVFYSSSRKWFLDAMFHVATPGFRRVRFRDFFLADLLISATFFYASLYMTICMYAGGSSETCSPRRSLITPVFISIPLLIRVIQCSRMFLDDDKRKIHAANGVKYLIAMSAVFSSSVFTLTKNGGSLSLWIVLGTISALYGFVWDIKYDWNVFGKKERMLSRKALYTFTVANFFLRFNWILTINAFLLFDQVLFSFLFGCLEVVRRYIWALFRMEREHMENVENYRAIKDIPYGGLPQVTSHP
jgi:hypothetical protein